MVQRRPSSCRRRRHHPGCHRVGSQLTEGAAADQMALDVEVIVDGGMSGEKSLG